MEGTSYHRCGCGNLARLDRQDDGEHCTCMCHPANQQREDARIQQMLAPTATPESHA